MLPLTLVCDVYLMRLSQDTTSGYPFCETPTLWGELAQALVCGVHLPWSPLAGRTHGAFSPSLRYSLWVSPLGNHFGLPQAAALGHLVGGLLWVATFGVHPRQISRATSLDYYLGQPSWDAIVDGHLEQPSQKDHLGPLH